MTAACTLPTATDERRHYARIAFHCPAQLVFSAGKLDVVVLDISIKGALIRLPANAALPNGALCQLHVELDAVGEQISMEARVTHLKDGNAGLRCQVIDLDSITHLRRLVELNLGDPQLLERELSALVAE